MSFELFTTPRFNKEFKRLAKKYPSLKAEVVALSEDLLANPLLGVPIGNNCYKVRLSIASKGKGKSGGARVISNIRIEAESIFLLTIYDKSEQDSISEKELELMLKMLDMKVK